MNDISNQKLFPKGKTIAIDGPAGSGKSTTARMIAERLGYVYLDTGAMYRAVTFAASQGGISPSDSEALTSLANELDIRFVRKDGFQQVLIGDQDVTSEIRTPEVTLHVSEVSAHQGVRVAMVRLQRQIGDGGSIVAEGRDTTTVVFPKADLKIFLLASIRVRAERRKLELDKAGVDTTVELQESDIRRRDDFDSGREHSPLTQAADAKVVDTSKLSIEEQVEQIIQLAEECI